MVAPPAIRDLLLAIGVYLALALVWFPGVLLGQVISQVDMLYFLAPWDAVRPEGLVVPGNPVLADQTREFWVFFQVARESFAALEFPLWNPYIFGGTPLLANAQSALLFPLNIVQYLAPAWGFTFSAIAKLVLAASGLYLLARSLRLGHAAALIGGAIYAFAAFNVFWLNHPHTNVTALFPWALWAAHCLALAPGRRWLALLGLIVGLQLLGGHVELAFLTAVATGIWFAVAVGEERGWRSLLPDARWLVGAYLLGSGLAALMVLPFLEFLGHSVTWAARHAENVFFLPPAGLLSWVTPEPFQVALFGDAVVPYQAINLYLGVAALVLAGLAVSAERSNAVKVLLFLTVLGLAMVFKVQPVFWLLTRLPLLREAPAFYFVIFPVISLSVLAAMGADALLERPRLLKWRAQAALWGGVFLLIIAASFLPPARTVFAELAGTAAAGAAHILSRLQGFLAQAVLVAGLVLSMPWLLSRLPAARAALIVLLLGVCVAPGWWQMRHWNPVIRPAWTAPARPGVLAGLAGEPGLFRVTALGDMLPPNTGALAGLQDLRGYDVPVIDRFHYFHLQALGGGSAYWRYWLPLTPPPRLAQLGLLNVRYILAPAGVSLPMPRHALADGAVVYENSAAGDRAWFAGDVRVVDTPEAALEAVSAAGFDRRTVVLEARPRVPPGHGDGSVRIRRYGARRVDLEVEAAGAGYVVLADTWYPGWRATVDGQPAPVLRADYLLRAVPVAAGAHRLSLSYRPRSFLIGAVLSALSLVCILWLLKKNPKSSS